MPQVTTPGQNAVDTPCDESGINGYRPSPMINSMPPGEILVALIISQSFYCLLTLFLSLLQQGLKVKKVILIVASSPIIGIVLPTPKVKRLYSLYPLMSWQISIGRIRR